MRRITGAAFVSLDGVMQAPGGPDEDPSGGFMYGGWLPPISDDGVNETVGMLFSPPYALLLGRATYDIFAGYWPFVEGDEKDFSEALTAADKYVVTHRGGLDWANSHRLSDLDAVAELKASDGPDLLIQGSSTLYPALLERGLIDRLVLMIFPVVLGAGKRLLGPGTPPRAMRLDDHRTTPNGAVIATYHPGGDVQTGSFVSTERDDRAA